MWKLFAVLVSGLASLTLLTVTASAQGGTTRIEPRPYAGAIVTLEHGVRVFRPLPPTNRVIINPNGATPLTLGFNESYVYENRRSYNYHHHEGGRSSGGHGGYNDFAFPTRGFRGRGFRGRRGGSVGGIPAGRFR